MSKKIPAVLAAELVKVGLQSGSIKLLGATSMTSTFGPATMGGRDAEYLLALLNNLTDGPFPEKQKGDGLPAAMTIG